MQQARAELATRLLAEAHQAVTAGNAEAAEAWIAAAAEAGADAAEVETLRTAAAQLRGAVRADSTARLETLFNQRMSQGRVLEPAGDSARSYLEQLAQAEPASSSTLSARSAFETRLTDEARAAVHAQDYPGRAALAQRGARQRRKPRGDQRHRGRTRRRPGRRCQGGGGRRHAAAAAPAAATSAAPRRHRGSAPAAATARRRQPRPARPAAS